MHGTVQYTIAYSLCGRLHVRDVHLPRSAVAASCPATVVLSDGYYLVSHAVGLVGDVFLRAGG